MRERNPVSYADKIVLTANSLVGQEEVRGNMGFKDAEFEEMMKAVGWSRTQAWCCYFCELVWKMVYLHDIGVNKELSTLFSGSTVQTWKNFLDSDWMQGTVPIKGAIVIWQKYKDGEPQWSGHAGIVTDIISPAKFESVEGNTNAGGSREGYIVAKKNRILNLTKESGLRVLGFIHPNEYGPN